MARPADRDPSETRERVLQAAFDAFATHGYDGARLDAIVQSSGYNPNTIYYHFGSKEGLFIAVMEEAYRRIRVEHQDIELLALPPDEAIRALARHIFRVFLRDRRFVNLLNSENLHRAEHIKKSDRIRGMYDPIVETLAIVVERGANRGLFRTGIDPRELFITISALGYFYVSNLYTLSVILSEDLEADERVAERERHVCDVVLSFLRDGRTAVAAAE